MEKLIEGLSAYGYYIWDDFLSHQEVCALRECIPEKWKQARIGRSDDAMRLESIRSDKIQWLNEAMGRPVHEFLDKMETVRLEVNRNFYLGLFEYEAHFAKYEKGDLYQKHLDSFQGNKNRRLTTVFYLNDNWNEEDAGELVVYDLADNKLITIPPKAGRLFVFFSERFPHEVLPTNSERFSIAGWFRVNGVKGNQLDIAC
ncbi:2OG-Fe(II) oxygenase [Vibrio sagamiensis]|uniref:SM-20 n=1 Tax=Vibrio sagamiensis NBRC 104589 TaxID=1219064 RepID=A0A511QB53_9VIBR|nr:2OG-Fe(II) oxygenase [Vibrio sagamiensis]GEM74505.1 SM-20 [Vibrio sagamiensis NBRC 104589]